MSFTRLIRLAILLLSLVFASTVAHAQLSLFIFFNTDASGISLGGSGTAAASMSMGTVKAYGGSVPSGVTKSINGTTDWTLSTPFDIDVVGISIIVPSFTLTAKLQSADAVNTWKIAGFTLNSVSATTLTTTGTYNVNTPYTFSLTIPFSEAAGSISNTLVITAIGN